MACPAVAPVAMEMRASKQEPLRRRAPSSPVTPVQPDALQRRARDHDTHPCHLCAQGWLGLASVPSRLTLRVALTC